MTATTAHSVVALCAVVVVVAASVVIGMFGVRWARSTQDFVMASRPVGPVWNAAAMCGEYLSAASFLGVAGMVLKDGADGLWFPIGYTVGHLGMLVFVAAPMRRAGAYTAADFAEFRLGESGLLRRVCAGCVVVIGWLYLVPQLQGAGLTLAMVAPGTPDWAGAVLAAVVVCVTVAFGGMRSITFVQAFHFWVKVTALAVPVAVLGLYFGTGLGGFNKPAPPAFRADTTVTIHTDVALSVAAPVWLHASGVLDGRHRDGSLHWAPGPHTAQKGAVLVFPAGAAAPVPAGSPAKDTQWLKPMWSDPGRRLFGVYALLLVTFLGTMGLPHTLARVYAHRDGVTARRTALITLGLLGGFYLLPILLGALSRLYVPRLLVSGDTDATVLALPTAALGPTPLAIGLTGLVTAGAWAAFLATSAGLVTGVAGLLTSSTSGGAGRSGYSTTHRAPARRPAAFRVAVLAAGIVPLGLALGTLRTDFAMTVLLAFTVAASTFAPLLLLGIWWRGLTDHGAIAGLAVGGLSSTAAVTAHLLRLAPTDGPLGLLCAFPGVLTVPAAFATMTLVSLHSPHRRPPDTQRLLLRLHAPEHLGLTHTPDQANTTGSSGCAHLPRPAGMTAQPRPGGSP